MTAYPRMMSLDSESSMGDKRELVNVYRGILNDDAYMLQECVDKGVNLNWTFKGGADMQHAGMTPLALAAALNKPQALQFLLANGANINDTFASLRTTALMTSAFHGHVKVVELLLKHGANVQAIDLQGSTALGYAFGGSRSLKVIELLIRNGININQKNMLGMNALLLVAGYGDFKLVEMVLNSKADPNSTNDFGHTALHLVIVGKRSQIKKLSQNGNAGRLTVDNFNNLKTPEVALKDWAARHKHLPTDSKKLEKAANLMTNIGAKVQKAFLKSVEDNEQEVIKQRVEAVWLYRQEKLLRRKKMLKKSGKLESFLGCKGKKDPDDIEAARPYLAAPSRSSKKITTEKDKEISDLKEKFASILMMIAKAGCDVTLTEKTFGLTALDMAILLEDVESTGLLISFGGDPEHLLKMFALSDLHESICSGDKRLVEKLISYDADLDLNHHFSAFNVENKSEEVQDEMVDSEGMNPLSVAVQMPEDESNAVKIIKILIKNKVDLDKMGPAGSFALAEAARSGNLRMCQMLLSHGAVVDQVAPKYNNATPFLIAAMYNQSDVAQFLSDHRAMMDHETTDGKCALTEAFRNDNMRIIETVMRGSLASAFKDRMSFTYEMVAKYQRPDKNMNLIMKLIGHQVKKVDGIKSGFKPKITENKVNKIESSNEKSSKNIQNRSPVKENHSKKANVIKNVESALVRKPVEEVIIEKKICRPLQTGEFGSSLKNQGYQAQSQINKNCEEWERGATSLINEGKEKIKKGKKKLEKDFQEFEEEMNDNVFEGYAKAANIVRNTSELAHNIHRSAESPIKSLFLRAEQSKVKNFDSSDEDEEEENNFQNPNKNVTVKVISQRSSDVSEEDYEEDEWEKDKEFKDNYCPANDYKGAYMTTPILGRCFQVRSNLAQADNYLKDVVNAGNSKRLMITSAIRSIEPDFSDEEDNLTIGDARISSDFRSLNSKYPNS